MAKKRMITQSINMDEDFNSLSDQSQLLFLKLLTIADDCGVIPGNSFSIKSLVSLSLSMNEKFSKYLQEITVNKLLFPIIHNDKFYFCFKKDSYEDNQKYLIKNRTKSEYMKVSIDEFNIIYGKLREFTVKYSDNGSYHIERIKIKDKVKEEVKDAENPKTDIKEIKPKTLHVLSIELFCNYYQQTKGIKYIFQSGKDGVAIKSVIKNIKAICTPDKQSDEDILKAFNYMLQNINDSWVIDNLSISVLNSKFNQIISQIKNGKSTNTNGKGFDPRKNTWFTGVN